MRLQLFCNKIPTCLIFNFLFLLPNITARSTDHIYFSKSVANILLEGPANPENGQYVLQWRPHSGGTYRELGIFSRDFWGSWTARWNVYLGNNDFYRTIYRVHAISTKIGNPAFKFAGLLTLIQKQPKMQLLKKYELFGLKVEVSAQKPAESSDLILSCSISRLPDTVSLHWKQWDLTKQNRSNTEQIFLNNTVYLMVRHVAVEDEKLFVCEVQENRTVVHTIEANFVVTELYRSHITLFRSGTDHSELHLNCYYRDYSHFTYAKWDWTSHLHQIQEKGIANGAYYEAVNVDRTYFKNRLETIMPKFNGKDFSARIVPVLFEDAGVYKCSMDSYDMVIIKLITVKVTAEPSNAMTEGDTVTLTCSVSDITSSMRLVWINADGKTVGEKKVAEKEKSLNVTIQKSERGRANWRCGLLYEDKLHLLIPYYLEPNGSENSIYFFHQEGNFVLRGPDNPGNGSIVWEWRPHSGQQTTRRLATFNREGQRWAVQWSDEYYKTPGISERMHMDWGTLNLRIRKPTFELAGLFTWTQPGGKVLRQWEVFGIKVEADLHRPVIGSDITLRCTISRLPDTVRLHWKPRGSSKQDWRNNTDQIHLNNTIYLMVRHVGAGSPHLYMWEVRKNGSIVLTGDPNIEVDRDLHNRKFTVYRSDTVDSELNLICEASAAFTDTKWTWRSQRFQNQEKDIASTRRSQPINVDRSAFGNRLGTTVGNLSGLDFSLRIAPVRFEDAGVFTCSVGTYKYVTVELITVKVTAEPSDSVTEGDIVTLTCSISQVTESMRLVWINGDGKTVEEETFKEQRQEAKSLLLIILNADRDRRMWTCGLFYQNTPKILIPFSLNVKCDHSFKHTTVVITGCLALFLIIILVVVLSLRKCKQKGLRNKREKPPQSTESMEDEPHLYSSPNEIHQIQRSKDKLVPNAEYMSVSSKAKKEGVIPEASNFAEYSNVNKEPIQEDREEDIHYGTLSFQKKAPDGHRHGLQSPSNINLVSSKEDEPSVIYAQIAHTKV